MTDSVKRTKLSYPGAVTLASLGIGKLDVARSSSLFLRSLFCDFLLIRLFLPRPGARNVQVCIYKNIFVPR
jgi:hypothetical protein